MKTFCQIVSTLTLSTSLFAQTSTNAPEPTFPPPSPLSQSAVDKIHKMVAIFDGKTLNGWIEAPKYISSISGDDITDLPGLAKKLAEKSDPVSAFLNEQLDDAVKTQLTEFSPASTNAKAVKSALAKNLTKIGSGPLLYEQARFQKVELRPETTELRKQNPQGQAGARLNRLLLEDAYPAEISRSPATSWTVKDGAMSSVGAGRGVIYTKDEYTNYRLILTMRHVSGQPDHAPCILVYCTTPPTGEKGLDALGGLQFQPPNGGSWDYRPGKNNGGKGIFTRLPHPKFDSHEWHQVELLVNTNGIARMAVAQPPGTKAVEVLQFNDPTAGKKGPIAWQMHNKGLFDEFKDVRIEENPKDDKFITTE